MKLKDGVFIESVLIDGDLLVEGEDWERYENERLPLLLDGAYKKHDLMHHDSKKTIYRMIVKYSDKTELVFCSAGGRHYDDEKYIPNP